MLWAFLGLWLVVGQSQAWAWENHALGTYVALRAEWKSEIPKFPAESLESFLTASQADLGVLLEGEEEWASQNVPHYPRAPENLRFEESRRENFLQAIRVNPNVKLPLFLQTIPGQFNSIENVKHSRLDPSEVTLLPQSLNPFENRFESLEEGEWVSALDILSTASDEPDYGMDIDLWEDNPSSFGAIYKWGKQPFGNPVLDFSSQAPFHMGFFHESRLAYTLVGFLSRTYSESRIHLFSSLASYSFKNNHPYWGLRFAGWGLHYVQDLTQPYHTTAFPGVSLLKMIYGGVLKALGFPKTYNDHLQLITNRHLALENYEFYHLYKALDQGPETDSVLQALGRSTSEDSFFKDSTPRDQISKFSHRAAKPVDRTLASSLPAQLVSDPGYLFSVTDPNIDITQLSLTETESAQLNKTLAILMEQYGYYSRTYIHIWASYLQIMH